MSRGDHAPAFFIKSIRKIFVYIHPIIHIVGFIVPEGV